MTYTPGTTVVLSRDWYDLPKGHTGTIVCVCDDESMDIEWQDCEYGPDALSLSEAREVLEVVL